MEKESNQIAGIYTAKTLAEVFECNPRTIGDAAASGELDGVKVGRSWVFLEEDVIAWLKMRKNKPKPGVKGYQPESWEEIIG